MQTERNLELSCRIRTDHRIVHISSTVVSVLDTSTANVPFEQLILSSLTEILMSLFYTHTFWLVSNQLCKEWTEDRRSKSLCSLYGQLSQGWMANFPAFIASKCLTYKTIIYLKWNDLICSTFWCIKRIYDNFEKKISVNQIDDLQSSNKK